MKEHIGNTLQGLVLASVLWTGGAIQDVTKAVAVHEWRIAALEKR